jgi:hypothetical protein
MKGNFLILLFALALVTCKKKEEPVPEPPEFSETSLQGIDYFDYDPDLRINSIRTYGDPSPPSGLNVGLPVDTSCTLTFTLPGEPISTIKIDAGNYYEHNNNGTGVANNYKKALTFSFTPNDHTISSGMDCATILSGGQLPDMGSNVRWTNSVSLNQPSPQNCSFTCEGYMPVKRLISGKRISYGWIFLKADGNGVIVKEAAFNRVHNEPLACGRKQ